MKICKRFWNFSKHGLEVTKGFLERRSEDVHTIVKFVESTLAVGVMFMHSGELLTISSKEFSMFYMTCFTAFPIFLMARMTAAGYKCKWLPLIVDVIFVFLSSISYLVVFVYVAADLRAFSNLRQELRLEVQLIPLNPDASIARLSVLALLAVILLMDAGIQIGVPFFRIFWARKKK